MISTDQAHTAIRARIREPASTSHTILPDVHELKSPPRQVLSPVERLEAALHPWVAYGIMPLFALANAGVPLRGLAEAGRSVVPITAGIVLGLVLGKPIGIVLTSWIAIRLRWCALPQGVGWRHVAVLGCLGGIGFTMSIFVATLAFPDPDHLATAKFAVLVASAMAATTGLVLGRRLLHA